MKRLFLLSMLCVLAVGAWAQGDLDSTYMAIVQPGKVWHMGEFGLGRKYLASDYYFKNEDPVSINGHEYRKLYYCREQEEEWLMGYYREENKRVFEYVEMQDKEYLVYDFNFQVGDDFTYDNVPFKVVKVGERAINGKHLKTITLEAQGVYKESNEILQVEWIAGVGSTERPFDRYLFTTSSWARRLAYVTDGALFLPFSFHFSWNHWSGWQGQQLQKYGDGDSSQKQQLNYELIPTENPDICTLHVSGQMLLNGGSNHYIYCLTKEIIPDESGLFWNDTCQVTFQEEAVEPLKDDMAYYYVDFYVPDFKTQCTYIVLDERGEHKLLRTDAYRPFIEANKVWKLGYFPERRYEEDEGPIAERVEYQYFDGDTVVAGRHCSRWMRTEMDADGSAVSYAGAAYEEGQRVYIALPGSTDFQLLYDFNNRTDTFFVCDNSSAGTFGRQDVKVVTTASTAVETETFKGLFKTVYMMDYLHRSDVRAWVNWRQGVGYKGLYNVALENPMDEANPQLMSCSVGGDVLYLNRQLHDGVNPTENFVKTQQLDFTHTVKTRPKAPERGKREKGKRKNGEGKAPYNPPMGDEGNNEDEEGINEEVDGEQELTGEYSETQLLVNLQPLKGICAITIQNDANQIVSTRQVQTTTLIAVTEDLTTLPVGRYTVSVENEGEAYTATFTLPLDGTGVRSPQMVNGQWSNGKCYNLTGRRLIAPPVKGIYIENGQKKVVR